MSRATQKELQTRMRLAAEHVPQGVIARNLKTGDQYMVRSHSLSASDVSLQVQYAPLYGPVIIFTRALHEFQKKFERVDGMAWKPIPFIITEDMP